MSIHISEPGHPVGTRLPESFRARRVMGKDAPQAPSPTANNRDRPVDPGQYQIEQQQVRRALREYQDESGGEEPDTQSPYLAVERLASPVLLTLGAGESVLRALETMEQHYVHHLVIITERGDVAGLVDQEWILKQLWRQATPGTPLANMELPAFITVTPETDAHHLAQQMLGHQLSAALVIDRNNQPAAIVTSTDFLRLYAESHHLHTTI